MISRILIPLLCGCFLLLQTGYTQSSRDDLLGKIEVAESDEARLIALLDAGKYYQNISTDSIRYFAQKSLLLARELEKHLEEGVAIFLMGQASFFEHKYEEARPFYLEAYKIFTAVDHERHKAGCLISLREVEKMLGNEEKAQGYLTALKALVSDSPDAFLRSHLQSVIANSYLMGGDLRSAKSYQLRSLRELKKESDTAYQTMGLKADLLNNLGAVLMEMGQIDSSSLVLIEAAKINESLQNLDKLAFQYLNIGQNFSQSGNFQMSLDYFGKALEIYQQKDNFELLGRVYHSAAISSRDNYHFNLYRLFLENSAEVFEDNNIAGLFPAQTYSELAVYYFREGEMAKAKSWLRKTLSNHTPGISQTIDQNIALAQAAISLMTGDLKTAEKHLVTDIESGQLQINAPGLKWYYELLSSLYEAQGKYRHALEVQKKQYSLSDSLNYAELSAQANEIQVRYDVEVKEKALLQSELKNQRLMLVAEKKEGRIRLWGLGTGLVLVILLLILRSFYRNNQHKKRLLELAQQQAHESEKNSVLIKEKHLLEIEQLEHRALQAQMSPHFIFNSLASLKSAILKKNFIRAESYLAHFSKLVRLTLESTRKKSITVEDEIQYLKTFLHLEQLRFPDRLSYQVSIDENVEPELMEIPPLLIQPFVENAIQHGISNLDGEIGKVSIRFEVIMGKLKIEVEDNGPGMEKAETFGVKSKNGLSLSKKIVSERLAKLFPEESNLVRIISPAHHTDSPKGTLIKILIPLADYSPIQ